MVKKRIEYCQIAESEAWIEQAAQILTETFTEMGVQVWPDHESARREVLQCIQEPRICIGIHEGGDLLGWTGLRPMYQKTWELHPLVVATRYQRRGFGRMLVGAIEKAAREQGIIGVILGSDDDQFKTSLSRVSIRKETIWDELKAIRNLDDHPYTFYEKCGYMIVGMVPNASGKNIHDIWMWKGLE